MRRSASSNISEIFVELKSDLDKVFAVIDNELSDCDKSLTELIHFPSLHSGKMIRPALVLLCGSLCGEINQQHYIAAAVIQMVHQATLLHDDVIDNAEIRRGNPTVNILYGNESAILLGDLLLSKALKLAVKLPADFMSRFAATTCDLCQGELRQAVEKKNWLVSEEKYFDIISKKSASLFGLCCYCGAALAQAPQNKIDALESFGRNIGIGFQIADDVLDITGDEKKLGKTLGTDVETNKLTLPVIHLLGFVSKAQQAKIIESLTNKKKPVDIKWLNQLFEENKSFEYSLEKANQHITQAVERLDIFEDLQARGFLAKMAHFTIDRLN